MQLPSSCFTGHLEASYMFWKCPEVALPLDTNKIALRSSPAQPTSIWLAKASFLQDMHRHQRPNQGARRAQSIPSRFHYAGRIRKRCGRRCCSVASGCPSGGPPPRRQEPEGSFDGMRGTAEISCPFRRKLPTPTWSLRRAVAENTPPLSPLDCEGGGARREFPRANKRHLPCRAGVDLLNAKLPWVRPLRL